MSNVIDVIEMQLRALATEAGSKQSHIRDTANYALKHQWLSVRRDEFLQAVMAATHGEHCTPVDELIVPFLCALSSDGSSHIHTSNMNHNTSSEARRLSQGGLASATSNVIVSGANNVNNKHNTSGTNAKLVVIALTALQSLLAADLLDSNMRHRVMNMLLQHEGSQVQAVQVKILQTLPLLLTPRLIPVNEKLLEDAVSICCRFHSRLPHLANAGINQIVTLLFEKVENELHESSIGQSGIGSASSSPHSKRDDTNGSIAGSINGFGVGRVMSAMMPLSQNAMSALALLRELLTVAARAAGGMSMTTAARPQNVEVRQSLEHSHVDGVVHSHLSSSATPPPKPPKTAHVQRMAADTQSSRQGWLSRVPITSVLALDLLETILSSHSSLFTDPRTSHTFGMIVQRDVCPLVLKLERSCTNIPQSSIREDTGRFQDADTFALTVHTLRLVVLLSCSYRGVLETAQTEQLLSLMLDQIKTAAQDVASDPNKKRVFDVRVNEDALVDCGVAIEAIYHVCCDETVMSSILDSFQPPSTENWESSKSNKASPSLLEQLVDSLSYFTIAAFKARKSGGSGIIDHNQGVGGSDVVNSNGSSLSAKLDRLNALVHSKGPSQGPVAKGLQLLRDSSIPSDATLEAAVLHAAETLASVVDRLAEARYLLAQNELANNQMDLAVHGGRSNTDVVSDTFGSQRMVRSPPLLSVGTQSSDNSGFVQGVHKRRGSNNPALPSPSKQISTANVIVKAGKFRKRHPSAGASDFAPLVFRSDSSRNVLTESTTVGAGSKFSNESKVELIKGGLTRSRAMLAFAWRPILEALSTLLQHCNEENMVQFLLKVFMSLTNTCGVLGLVQPRDTLISKLCIFTLPNWQSEGAMQGVTSPSARASDGNSNGTISSGKPGITATLTVKHIQALKALFNIAHGLGAILGTSWHMVLETFQQLDYILFCAAKMNKDRYAGGFGSNREAHASSSMPATSNGGMAGGRSISDVSSTSVHNLVDVKSQEQVMMEDEMRIVTSMLASIFESTVYLDDDAVVSLGTALTQLSFTVLANMATLHVAPSSAYAVDADAASELNGSELNNNINNTGMQTANDDNNNDSSSSNMTEESSGLGSTARGVFSAFTSSISSMVGGGKTNGGGEEYRSLSSRSGNTPPNKKGRAKWSSEPEKSQRNGASESPNASPTSARLLSSSTSPNTTSSANRVAVVLVEHSKSRESVRREMARMTYRSPPFALEKLVETGLLNVFRIDCVWDMTHTLLSTVVSKHDDEMRMYAVRAMERIVTKSLTFNHPSTSAMSKKDTNTSHNTNTSFKTNSNNTNVQDQDVNGQNPDTKAHNQLPDTEMPTWLPSLNYENELVEPFVLLLQQSAFLDARLEALEGLFRIVSNAGDRLRLSWPLVIRAVLRVLKGATSGTNESPLTVDLGGDGTPIAAEDEKRSSLTASLDGQHIMSAKQLAPLLPKAGQVIQLVLDNHFEMLDAGAKNDLVQCVRLLGEQTVHVNLSLSAVQTMFFAVCDNVERERNRDVKIEAVTSDVTEGRGGGGGRTKTTGELTGIEVVQRDAESVWMNVFGQLRRLSLNIRPEVRNSAIATLCAVLKTCAPHLGIDAWRRVVCHVLLPLLEAIDEATSLAESDGGKTVLGEKLSRMGDARMMIHHSRDTLGKQWLETKECAIRGVTSVVKVSYTYVGQELWFRDAWKRIAYMLQTTYDTRTSKKVSIACVRALHSLAAVVCVGLRSGGKAGSAKRVINGALVEVDPVTGAPIVDTDRNNEDVDTGQQWMHLSLVAGGRNGQLPTGYANDNYAKLEDLSGDVVGEELWNDIRDVFENMTTFSDQAEVEDNDSTNGSPSFRSVAAEEMHLATEIAGAIDDLYTNSKLKFLRSSEAAIQTIELLGRLIRMYPMNLDGLLTTIQRASLKAMMTLPPLPNEAWSFLLKQLHAFHTSTASSAAFAAKSKEAFAQLLCQAPRMQRFAFVEDTVRQLRRSVLENIGGGLLRVGDNLEDTGAGAATSELTFMLEVIHNGLPSMMGADASAEVLARNNMVWTDLVVTLRTLTEQLRISTSRSVGTHSAQAIEATTECTRRCLIIGLSEICSMARNNDTAEIIPWKLQQELVEMLVSASAQLGPDHSLWDTHLNVALVCVELLFGVVEACGSDRYIGDNNHTQGRTDTGVGSGEVQRKLLALAKEPFEDRFQVVIAEFLQIDRANAAALATGLSNVESKLGLDVGASGGGEQDKQRAKVGRAAVVGFLKEFGRVKKRGGRTEMDVGIEKDHSSENSNGWGVGAILCDLILVDDREVRALLRDVLVGWMVPSSSFSC